MAKEKISLFDYPARIVKKGLEELTELFLGGEINPDEYKEIIVTQGKVYPAPIKEEKNYTSDGFYKPGLKYIFGINTKYRRK